MSKGEMSRGNVLHSSARPSCCRARSYIVFCIEKQTSRPEHYLELFDSRAATSSYCKHCGNIPTETGRGLSNAGGLWKIVIVDQYNALSRKCYCGVPIEIRMRSVEWPWVTPIGATTFEAVTWCVTLVTHAWRIHASPAVDDACMPIK